MSCLRQDTVVGPAGVFFVVEDVLRNGADYVVGGIRRFVTL